MAGVAVLVLTVIALVRDPVELDHDSPEGTVQAYLQAISDRDYSAAHGYLSANLQDECLVADVARDGPYETFTATLGDVDDLGTRTLVNVSIRIGSDGAFGSAGYSFDPGPYVLQQESGRWVITEVSWPYFYYGCST